MWFTGSRESCFIHDCFSDVSAKIDVSRPHSVQIGGGGWDIADRIGKQRLREPAFVSFDEFRGIRLMHADVSVFPIRQLIDTVIDFLLCMQSSKHFVDCKISQQDLA